MKRADILPEGLIFSCLKKNRIEAAIQKKALGVKRGRAEQMIFPYEVMCGEDVFDAAFLELPQRLFACAP